MNELFTHPVTPIVVTVVLAAIIIAIVTKVRSDRRKKDAAEARRVELSVDRQLRAELHSTPKPRHRGTRAVRPAPAAQRVRRVSTPVSTPTVRSRDANDDLGTFIIPATTFIVADTLYPDPTPSNDPAPSPSPDPSPSPSYDSGGWSSDSGGGGSYDSGSSGGSSDSGGSFGGGDSGSF